MFEASLVDDTARTARPYTVSLSAVLQVAAAALAVTYPLWHIEPLPKVRLRSPFRNATLVDIQPRSQPASRPQTAAVPQLSLPQQPTRPLFIPRPSTSPAAPAGPEIDVSSLAIGPSSDSGPYVPGPPSGPGGGGGGPVIALAPSPAAPPPQQPPAPRAAVTGPVRPGGNVRPPQLLREVKPVYPALAVQTRTQGTVRIEAIIARDGMVRYARVVSGHPLLVAAALDAVRQWRYRPTNLNGEPVEVALALEVNFTLSR